MNKTCDKSLISVVIPTYCENHPGKNAGNVEISVIMQVFNDEKQITESIESILNQSFPNFELILVDKGSLDNTLSIIHSYSDPRMIVLQTRTNSESALNTGLQKAKGKYIVRMEAGDLMHIDRLRIQHAIMEEEACISVCGTWTIPFGEDVPKGRIRPGEHGLIKFPLLQLLKENFLLPSTAIIRKDFLDSHRLQYEYSPYTEDYKLWYEIAKQGGVFYIESQPLLYHRIFGLPKNDSIREEQESTPQIIRREILEYLIAQNKVRCPELPGLYDSLLSLKAKGLFSPEEIYLFFYAFLLKNERIVFSTG